LWDARAIVARVRRMVQSAGIGSRESGMGTALHTEPVPIPHSRARFPSFYLNRIPFGAIDPLFGTNGFAVVAAAV